MPRHPPLARFALVAAALSLASCGLHRPGEDCVGSEAPVCETAWSQLRCVQGTWVSQECVLPTGCVPHGDVVSCAVVASDGGTPLDAGTPDAGTPDIGTPDGGLPWRGPYPAPHPAYPQVLNSGGPVLATPRAQVISFAEVPADFRQAAETCTEKLGALPYWSDIGKEYGVGPLSAAAPVHLQEQAPSSVDDDAVRLWLATKLDGGVPGFERPETRTIFTIVYPKHTVVGAGCDFVLGYHDSFPLGGLDVPYLVLPDCPYPGVTDLQAFTGTLSHELIEAATDPFPLVHPAYLDVDEAHVAWSLAIYGEVSDLCAQEPDWMVIPNGFPYGLQRSWSNAAARAGKNPCVPAPAGEVYFAAVPELNDDVPYTNWQKSGTTKGVRIPRGQTRTVRVHLFSEAPAEDWDLSADAFVFQAFTFSFDRSRGNNGDVVTLSITANFFDTSDNAGVFWVSATRAGGTAEHRSYGLIAP